MLAAGLIDFRKLCHLWGVLGGAGLEVLSLVHAAPMPLHNLVNTDAVTLQQNAALRTLMLLQLDLKL